jgi:3-methyladenine DNA glycosylase AlkD
VISKSVSDQLASPTCSSRDCSTTGASPSVVVDWFTSKVLVTLLSRTAGRTEVARQIATWRDADTIWQRRAACLAFIKLAPDGDVAITELALRICATVVWSHERFDQTAVGWLLRELSRGDPARVDAFVRRHARLMSKECARHAVSKFSVTQRTALLAHHKRATTLRR